MVCEEPIRASIWHAIHHYAYSDAIFLAERLYAEVSSDDALYLLATCYYQAGHPKRAYSILQAKGCPTPLCRFLFAKCCLDLDKLAEGEMALTGGCLTNGKTLENFACEFGTAAGYALALLGQICRKSEQTSRAAECFKSSLKYNPYLWTSFESLCRLGEKPDPSDYFKSSSCPKLQRQPVTPAISTAAMDSTNTDLRHGPLNPEPMATENQDPSKSSPFVTGSPAMTTCGGMFLVPPAPMSSTTENRPRHRVGRNLLGATQSSSPLSPSFGFLPVDTPPSEGALPFHTPSPSLVSELNVVKAPVKKSGLRQHRLDNTVKSGSGSHTQTIPSSPSSLYVTPPLGSASQTVYPSAVAPSIRRSTRLFTLNTSGSSSSNIDSGKDNKKTRSTRLSSAPRSASTTTRKTRRQTRSNTPQPLTPCVENVIQEELTHGTSNETKTQLKGSSPAVPTSVDNLMSLLKHIGQAYMHLCAYECKQALALFTSLPPHHHNTGWVLTQIGRVYFELAEYHMAEKVFSEVRKLEPYHLEGMEIYSTTLWHLQKEVALSTLAQDLVDSNRYSAQAWCATGNCFSLQKEHDTAIKFFQRAVQVDPSFTYAYTLLGHEYVLTEELDRAMSCFRRAIKSDCRHYNAWYGVGMIYYKQEKFNLADVHFRKALSINPSSSVLYCHVGVVQHAMKKSESALATINKAMQIDPRNPLCRFHRASILFSMDKYQEALKELEELKKIVPREALVFFLMGKVYKKLGCTHLAQMNFSWAIDLDPKGANNQIKEAIDKRYLPDDDDNTLGMDTTDLMDQSAGADASEDDTMGFGGVELNSESSDFSRL